MRRSAWLGFVQRLALCLTFGFITQAAAPVLAAEAEWIWSPAYEKELAPPGECYFRKTFKLAAPEHGEMQIGCDDNYELFINGRKVGGGENWKVLDEFDITQYLVAGNNTIAVKAINTEQGSAGLVARVLIKSQGGTEVAYSTDTTWKTSLKEFAGWQKAKFDDARWLEAKAFGQLGMTLPWGNEPIVGSAGGRFKVAKEFKVEWVVQPEKTGSLIAMTFDEFGQMIASREGGGLILIRDEDQDGLLETVVPLCDEVKNCQGLLCISGKVYAVGEGPEGTALYKLSDEDQDGRTERVEAILKFTGEVSEHGPHSLVLGPDGLIYMVVGNFARAEKKPEPSSPLRHFYEGDLITPKYEDAGGHAVGIKAPGGAILRTDTSGSAVELVAGGLQNPYDLTFNKDGELFTADSDMEWDTGFTWYRPTRVNHVVPGAEFGWRSGWSKWPDYYLDSLPPMAETGRGSPAGIESYDHFMYPARYHHALFVCDWSRGRILAVKTKPHGATYKATVETFLEGKPLNVTDIAVAPDGNLYFVTGGRETEGGVYRVVWTGKVPPQLKDLGTGIEAALKQPQLTSAWSRQQIAILKQKIGKQWTAQLTAVADDTKRSVDQRLRALDLMQIFGPYPSHSLLVQLSKDKQPAVRAKIAFLMGVHGDESTQTRLSDLLRDSDLSVQRAACEALVRAGQAGPIVPLVKLLASPDRHVAWAARRALQELPVDSWEDSITRSSDVRVFVSGSAALLAQRPERELVDSILKRASIWMDGYLSDDDFLDVLRVVEVALLRGEVNGDDVPDLRRKLAAEFPAGEVRMNRELVRLLVYLQEPSMAEQLVGQLQSDISQEDKLHMALHARFLKVGWTVALKLEMLQFYEDARTLPGGHSFAGYIENVSRDFFAGFDEEERARVLAEGSKWPSSALSVLAKLPEHPSTETLREIEKLDVQIRKLDSEAARRLRIGVVAVLGASRDEQAMEYLRGVYDREPDRRVPVAMSLAQQPDGENWPYLVRSLSIVEGAAAQEVLVKLVQVQRTPEDPEAFRQVILRGLLLGEGGSRHAVTLLEHWTGEKQGKGDKGGLAAWQKWFGDTYPELPEPKLPVESPQSNWTYQELYSFLNGPAAKTASARHGAAVFQKAQCIKCHRFGDKGDSVGPDLTTVSQRFQRKEILEALLYPSHVISDQYATQTVVTKQGRTISGMVAPSGDGQIVVLQASGEKLSLEEDDVESVTRSKTSVMPAGLLNPLSLEEIADLFAYLTKAPNVGELARKPTTTAAETKRK